MSTASTAAGVATPTTPDYDIQSLASNAGESSSDGDQESSQHHANSKSPSNNFSLPNLERPSQAHLTDSPIPFRAKTSHHHATWAKTFHSFPELYVTPESVAEVQRAVVLARKCRRRLMVVGGSAHSPSNLTCTSAWMLNLDRIASVLDVKKNPATGQASALIQAGISLHNLNLELARHNLTIPNLGSIDPQSIAGAISTATHGSSLRHGLLSQNVRGLRIVLADGRAVWCSPSQQPDLFRAALVSLGAIGIITEIEFAAVPASNIEWDQSLISLEEMLNKWNADIWTSHEYVRCWWMPYLQRVILWRADKTQAPLRSPTRFSWYGGAAGFYAYRALLWLAHYFPSILPTVEWFVFGMQYNFSLGHISDGVEPQRTGLLMDCLFSQFVNEWAVPLDKGPEIIRRLSKWINGDEEGSGIPFSSRGLYVHCPIEVRVTQGAADGSARAFLDPTQGPTLYLNATLYRPHGLNPSCRDRYYEAFEWLMKQYGGRPHWAKNFSTVSAADLRKMYGANLDRWLAVRADVDPDGMFVGAWHRRYLLGPDAEPLDLEEVEVELKKASDGGLEWYGKQHAESLDGVDLSKSYADVGVMRTRGSDESFEFVLEK